MRHRAAGFTLIEVLVAVTVLAVAMGALISGMGRYAANASALRDKTIALWVAHNRLTEIDLEPAWPNVGKSDGDVEMAGREWRWHVTVAETPDPEVRRVDIRVEDRGSRQEMVALSSFVTRAGRTP